MPDQGVVDHIQLELLSPLETMSSRGLNLMAILPLTGGSLYGSFGSTSRRSLTSSSLPPVFRAALASGGDPDLDWGGYMDALADDLLEGD